MKRSNFIKSIFAISGISISSTCISKPVKAEEGYIKGSILDAARTGKTISLTGDRSITIDGSSLNVAIQRDKKLNLKFR